MAEGYEIAKGFVTLVPTMQGTQSAIADELTKAVGGGTGAKAGGKLGGDILGGMKGAMAPAAVASALAGATKGLFDIGKSFDGMYDTIRTGTGATGEALDGLTESAKSVLIEVPTTVSGLGDTLAELNTRTGATGKTLEGLTKQFLELDRIGFAADIDKATGAMNAWGIETEDMGYRLDQLFTVSQATGAGMDDLASTMGANAATMQALGYSFEETAAMAGALDKAGLNAAGTLSKMGTAAVNLAKDGEQPAEALRRVTGEIQGYIESGEDAVALELASNIFGTKGASQFIQAVKTGALNVDDLAGSLKDAGGAISKNAEDTMDFQEKMDLLGQKAAIALEPLGSEVFRSMGDILDAAAPAAGALAGALGAVANVIVSIIEGIRWIGDNIGGVVSAAGYDNAGDFYVGATNENVVYAGMYAHADGGVFTSPHVGLIAEAGPEAVVPLYNPTAVAAFAEALTSAGASTGGGNIYIGSVQVPEGTAAYRALQELAEALEIERRS